MKKLNMILVFLTLATVFTTSSATRSHAAMAAWVDAKSQWYYDRYAPQTEGTDATITALSLDAAGSGWLATTAPGDVTIMRQMLGGRIGPAQFSFPGVVIEDMAMSQDNREGWAIGFNSANQNGTPPTVLLHYSDDKWTDATSGLSAHGMGYKLALDAGAKNGWAAGIQQIDGAPSTTLLHLVDGQWQDDTSTVPPTLVFTSIAADPAAQNAWAAAYVRGDAAGATLYHLVNGRWVSSVPSMRYVIQSLAVDGNGNGWALPSEHQFDASLGLDSLIRFHADGKLSMVPSDMVADANVSLKSLALDSAGNGWVLGSAGQGAGKPALTAIIQLNGDRAVNWQYLDKGSIAGNQVYPIAGAPNYLSISASGAAWAILDGSKLIRFGDLPFATPAPAAILDPTLKNQCFDNGYCLYDASFLSFWQQHGGLAQFGLPITEPLYERLEDGNIYLVQYTERARFEYHPENPTASRVLLGLLGNKLAAGRENEAPFQCTEAASSATYFEATGHNISGVIAAYWQEHGGLGVFGYPISEAFTEQSATDGKSYLVQYFERNRLEYHPENSDPQYQVLLGLLGVQQFRATYGTQP